jgi:hypothetical protein
MAFALFDESPSWLAVAGLLGDSRRVALVSEPPGTETLALARFCGLFGLKPRQC